MPTHLKRPYIQPGEGPDEDFNPTRKKITPAKKPKSEKGTPTTTRRSSKAPRGLQNTHDIINVGGGSPAVKRTPIIRGSNQQHPALPVRQGAPLGHFPGGGHRVPSEQLPGTPHHGAQAPIPQGSQMRPRSLSNGTPSPLGPYGNMYPDVMQLPLNSSTGMFTPTGQQPANRRLFAASPQDPRFAATNANIVDTPTQQHNVQAQRIISSSGSQQASASNTPSRATNSLPLQPALDTSSANSGPVIFNLQLPPGSSNVNLSPANPMTWNVSMPAGSPQIPATPHQSVVNTSTTPVGSQDTSTPGNVNMVGVNPRPLPGTWPAPPDTSRHIPTTIFEGLQRHIETGVYDISELMSIQFGIGLGIRQYKASLMNELASNGTIFGRVLLFDNVRDSAWDMRNRIEKRASEYFDLVQASLAGDEHMEYHKALNDPMTPSNAGPAGYENGGMIGKHGMIPDNASSATHEKVPSAALETQGNVDGMTASGGHIPGSMNANNNLPMDSFTAGGDFAGDIDNLPMGSFKADGDFVGGINMSQLDNTAGMDANTFCANTDTGGMTGSSFNIRDDAGELLGMYNQYINVPASPPKSNGNDSMRGTGPPMPPNGSGSGMDSFEFRGVNDIGGTSYNTPTGDQGIVPALTETKNGQAVIRMVPRGQ
ncbi:hypothetical protein F5B20DRAFT_584192 [Whalleya microplaca]|nr:hypothetical protein F5B20DRAFT_584192 [Whalleya microplaca]